MKFWWVLLIGNFLISCSSDDITDNREMDFGYEYFPLLEIEHTLEYEVNITVYSNDGKNRVSQRHFRKEEVVQSEGIIGHEALYRKDVYTRNDEAFPWDYSHTILVEMNPIQVIIHENNDRIIHLSFPAEVGKKWDGLSFVDASVTKEFAGEKIEFYKDWNFEISQNQESFEEYSDVIVINQADSENAIERRYSIEKYAKDIGLVYKEQIILDTQCLADCIGMDWEEKAQKGIILSQRLIRFN